MDQTQTNEKNVKEKPKISPAKRRQLTIRNRKYLRAAIQLFFFLAMPGSFMAGFSGTKYIFRYVSGGEVLQMNSFIKALIGLCLFTIIFGRFFCGYVCAFGSMGDFIHWLSSLFQKKVLKKKKVYAIPPKARTILQKVKYLNLLVIVVLVTFGKYPAKTSIWDVFSRLSSLKSVPEGYTIGVICLLLVMVGMAVQERFFCQFLCPLGAVFAMLPILPFGSLHRHSENCIKGCNACANQCPVSLKLQENGDRGGECIGCEKCVPTCPKGNISHTEEAFLKVPYMSYISVVTKAVLFFILGCFLGFCRFF